MNETKVQYSLMKIVVILNSAVKQVTDIVKGLDVTEGVFLVRANMGYDVSVDGIPCGMEVSYGKAVEIRDRIEAGRAEAGWKPSGGGTSVAEKKEGL